jgi:hypothetical protein
MSAVGNRYRATASEDVTVDTIVYVKRRHALYQGQIHPIINPKPRL